MSQITQSAQSGSVRRPILHIRSKNVNTRTQNITTVTNGAIQEASRQQATKWVGIAEIVDDSEVCQTLILKV